MRTRRLAEEGSRPCKSKRRSRIEDELVDHLDRKRKEGGEKKYNTACSPHSGKEKIVL